MSVVSTAVPQVVQAQPQDTVRTSEKFQKPFSSCSWVKSKTAKIWKYLDESGQIQGPYTSLQMDYWFAAGFFFNELLITCDQFKGKYMPLLNFLVKLQNLKQKTVKAPAAAKMFKPIMEENEEEDQEEQDTDGGSITNSDDN